MPNHFPKNSAGRRMTEKVPVARPEQTAGEVLQTIAAGIGNFDTIHSVYVVGPGRRLLGSLRFKHLYHLDPKARLGEAVHHARLVTVMSETHQENVAALAVQHELTEIPVVDRDGRLLGVVPDQAIVDILHREAREDVFRLTGVHPSHGEIDNVLEIPLYDALKHRLPWLVIGLFGGIAIARLIGLFERTLGKNLILASFIPLVVYMSDAVGTQMEAFVIRDFAVFRRLDFGRYFLKQFRIVLAIALFFGVSSAGIASIFYGWAGLTAVLGISVAVAILSSVLTGLIVPYLFRGLRLDPANASGPIATILQNLLSIVIYFGVATVIL